MTEEKLTVQGVEVPGWYLELEPKLLEQMEALEKVKRKVDALRTTIYNLMKDEDIDCIKTDLSIVTRTKSSFIDSIDKEQLKLEMPEIFDKYIKKTLRKGSIQVKLVTPKK